jgi:oligopeptide transport system permease protein
MVDNMMRYYGLDKPLFYQYVTYLGSLLQGDFGYSLKYAGRSVNQIIATTFPISAQLGLQALILSIPSGILLGMISAKRRGKLIDLILNGSTILVVSLPAFLIAAILQYIFALRLGWLPIARWQSFAHSILPTLALALPLIATRIRTMRTLMLEVNEQDYLKTAKAKGLGEFRIVLFHQFRNAVIPMITGLGQEIAGLLMGSFIIESVFSIPGLGGYFVNSIIGLDYTMVMGLTIFSSIFVVLANLVIDLLYGIIDPRIKIV